MRTALIGLTALITLIGSFLIIAWSIGAVVIHFYDGNHRAKHHERILTGFFILLALLVLLIVCMMTGEFVLEIISSWELNEVSER